MAGLLRVRKFQRGPAGALTQAEASGQIDVGDALVAVNGVHVAPQCTPQLLVQLLGRVGRPVHVAFRRLALPPPPPPVLAPASLSSSSASSSAALQRPAAVRPQAVSSPSSSSGADDGWAASLRSAAAAAADTMDPEVYAAAAAAASHMGSLAQSMGLGAAGMVGDNAPHDRSHSPLLEEDPADAEGGLGADADRPDLITHAEDGVALPKLAGERYSALLSGVQLEAFHRARLGDGGLQRTWVRGQV